MAETKRQATVPPDALRGQRGFTLIELLIVMGVSLFGLAGLMSIYTTTSSGNQSMSKSGEAVEICEETMEELRSMLITDIEGLVEYGAITAAGWGPVEFHDGDVVGRNGVVFARNVSAVETAASPSLVRLRVEVQWSDTGNDPETAPANTVHQVAIEMIRTREEAL